MTNVQIEINGEFLDVDEETAIGFNFQCYSFGKPTSTLLNYSNTFDVPNTAHNQFVFGFAWNVGFVSGNVYQQRTARIFIDGGLLFSAKCNVVEMTNEKISLQCVANADFFDVLKTIPFAVEGNGDCIEKRIADYFQDKYSSLNRGTAEAVFSEWIRLGTETAEVSEFMIPSSVGTMFQKKFRRSNVGTTANPIYITENVYSEDRQDGLEDCGNMRLSYFDDYLTSQEIKGAHFFTKIDIVAECIVDMLSSLNIESNLSDIIPNDCFLRTPDILPKFTYAENPTPTYWCGFRFENGGMFSEEEGKPAIMNGKTAYDFILYCMQEFNLVLDVNFNIDTQKLVYTFNYFDELEDAPLRNFDLIEIVSKQFLIDGIDQNNYIGYKELQNENDAKTTGALNLQCNNKNIDAGSTTDLKFTIDRLLCSYVAFEQNGQIDTTTTFDLHDADKINSFILVKTAPSGSGTAQTMKIHAVGVDNEDVVCERAVGRAVQDVVGNGEYYQLTLKVMQNPICYKVKVKATLVDVFNIRNYMRCTINGLVGTYYISKIDSYNPSTDNYLTMTIYRID